MRRQLVLLIFAETFRERAEDLAVVGHAELFGDGGEKRLRRARRDHHAEAFGGAQFQAVRARVAQKRFEFVRRHLREMRGAGGMRRFVRFRLAVPRPGFRQDQHGGFRQKRHVSGRRVVAPDHMQDHVFIHRIDAVTVRNPVARLRVDLHVSAKVRAVQLQFRAAEIRPGHPVPAPRREHPQRGAVQEREDRAAPDLRPLFLDREFRLARRHCVPLLIHVQSLFSAFSPAFCASRAHTDNRKGFRRSAQTDGDPRIYGAKSAG